MSYMNIQALHVKNFPRDLPRHPERSEGSTWHFKPRFFNKLPSDDALLKHLTSTIKSTQAVK